MQMCGLILSLPDPLYAEQSASPRLPAEFKAARAEPNSYEATQPSVLDRELKVVYEPSSWDRPVALNSSNVVVVGPVSGSVVVDGQLVFADF